MADLDLVKRRILDRVPLPALIGESVSLVTRSGRPIGLCPFHPEKSPSFYVYDDRYYCFGCKANGDAIEFVRKTQGLGYVEALRHLAGKYSIEAPELDEDRGRLARGRAEASLFRMMSDAQDFFAQNLAGPHGEEAQRYLLGRGFTPESIKAYGFGLTPLEGYGLLRHLRSRGYSEGDIIQCSLATPGQEGRRPYDFFRRRLMIPIRDGQGRLIAFGGRAMDPQDPAKYKNSRDTPLFDKSHTLFGLDRARPAIRTKGRAIVVEGYMDALQLWQAGFDETVACLGTAFTEHHLAKLKQATGLVILLFDGDQAGRRATLQTVNIALTAPEVLMRAVSLPDRMDPDDYVKRWGAEALESLLAKSSELLDFAVREKLQDVGPLAVPDLLSREFVPWLAKISDPIQRDFLSVRISQLTGVALDILRAHIPQIGRQPSGMTGLRGRSGGGHRDAQDERLIPSSGASRGVMPSRGPSQSQPLPPAGLDVLGHLFFAQPGELDVESVIRQLTEDLALDEAQLALVQEIGQILERGLAPVEQPPSQWISTSAESSRLLLEKLRKSEGAFACTNRRERVAQSLAYLRSRRQKETLAQLKTEAARLGRIPERVDDLRLILREIAQLVRETSP